MSIFWDFEILLPHTESLNVSPLINITLFIALFQDAIKMSGISTIFGKAAEQLFARIIADVAPTLLLFDLGRLVGLELQGDVWFDEGSLWEHQADRMSKLPIRSRLEQSVIPTNTAFLACFSLDAWITGEGILNIGVVAKSVSSSLALLTFDLSGG